MLEYGDIIKTLRIKKQSGDGDRPSWEFIDRVYEIIKPIFIARSYYLQRPILNRQCWLGIANKENLCPMIFLYLGDPDKFKTAYWYAQLSYPHVEKNLSEEEYGEIVELIGVSTKELKKIGMEEIEI